MSKAFLRERLRRLERHRPPEPVTIELWYVDEIFNPGRRTLAKRWRFDGRTMALEYEATEDA